MCIGLHVKCPFLGSILMKIELYIQIKKKSPYIKFESVQWGTCCSVRTNGQIDRQTDRHK